MEDPGGGLGSVGPITPELTGLDGLVQARYRMLVDVELVVGDGSARSFYEMVSASTRRAAPYR